MKTAHTAHTATKPYQKSSRIWILALTLTFGSGLVIAESTPESLCESLKRTAEVVQRGKERGVTIGEVLRPLDMEPGLSGSPDARASRALIAWMINKVYKGYSPAEIQELCLRAATSESGRKRR